MASPGNQHCANCIGTLSFPTRCSTSSLLNYTRLQPKIDFEAKKFPLNLSFRFCNPQTAHLRVVTVLEVY